VQSAVTGVVGNVSTGAYSALIQFETDAVGAYKQLAKLNPKDSITQYRLAQVAQGAGDTTVAVSAYEKFLKLAPDDPLAPTAKKALKQLKAQLAATATPATSKK
jgi:predicted TPR repeat methyltransferase